MFHIVALAQTVVCTCSVVVVVCEKFKKATVVAKKI